MRPSTVLLATLMAAGCAPRWTPSRWRFYRATALGKRVLARELARPESDVATGARAMLQALG